MLEEDDVEWEEELPEEEEAGSHELTVWFRYARFAGGALTASTVVNTYAYTPNAWSPPHQNFYNCLLAQRAFWARTENAPSARLSFEGGANADLNAAPVVLRDQAMFALVRDMITRQGGGASDPNGPWARYGVCGTGGAPVANSCARTE